VTTQTTRHRPRKTKNQNCDHIRAERLKKSDENITTKSSNPLEGGVFLCGAPFHSIPNLAHIIKF
jgi:hypothetical protein